jgi:peptidoglycan/xylan/chitin deacetylase (PgdA/CDA1 family)
MYHAVKDIKKKECASLELINEHLNIIKQQKWQVLNLKQFHDNFMNNTRKKSPEIVLTFDDGYIEVYEKIFPLCKKIGFPFSVFMPANYIGGDNGWNLRAQFKSKHLQADHLKEMAANNVDIGSHGMSHNNLLKLTKDEIDYELRVSKLTLERITKNQVVAFSYPYGDYNKEILAATKKYYGIAFAAADGYRHKRASGSLNEQILTIPRIDANYLSSERLFKTVVLYNNASWRIMQYFKNLYISWIK